MPVENTSCSTGKQCLTREEADERAERLRETEFARMNSYKCSKCNWWHVGHSYRKPKNWRTECQ
jgi:hypothetical protein